MPKIYKSLVCEICHKSTCIIGKNSYYTGVVRHHFKPVSKGGKYKDGYIYLCEYHHRLIHTNNKKLLWKETNFYRTIFYSFLSSFKRFFRFNIYLRGKSCL